MTLLQTAYLTIDDGANVGEFELSINLEETAEINKTFILSNRGQYIQEIYEQIVDDSDIATEQRRRGYHIDGGAGEWSHTLTFQTGLENVTWGDGSGGTGPDNVTENDASGENVNALSRKQVLENWVARTRTDSFGQAKLYWGEWSDGTYAAEAGAFGRPMNVAIREASLSSPEIDQDVNSFEGNLTVQRTSIFPEEVAETLDNAVELVEDALDGITDY